MRILNVIHDYLPAHLAGSEIYAHELGRTLRDRGHEVLVLCAEYDPLRRHGSLNYRFHEPLPVIELVNNWSFSSFDESYNSTRLNDVLGHVLQAVHPDILHIHSLLNLSLELPSLAHQQGIPSVATLHDFTLLCPSGGQRVQPQQKHLCLEIEPQRCADCFMRSPFAMQMALGPLTPCSTRTRWLIHTLELGRRLFPRLAAQAGQSLAQRMTAPNISANQIQRRLDRVQQLFEEIALFVAPSSALATEMQRFGLKRERIRVQDYGFGVKTSSSQPTDGRPISIVDEHAPASSSQPTDGRPIKIGFVGTLVWHKGLHVLLQAAHLLPRKSFEMLVYGDLNTFPAYVAELKELARGLPVQFKGRFDHDQAHRIFSRFDLLVVPSLWLENSPLVIHEAFLAGVPVVGSRLGGTIDLVSHTGCGLLYDPFSASDLAKKLNAIIKRPSRLAGFRHRIPQVRTLEQDARDWEKIYREVLAPGTTDDQEDAS